MPECVLHILFPECVHALALERVKENEMEMERERVNSNLNVYLFRWLLWINQSACGCYLVVLLGMSECAVPGISVCIPFGELGKVLEFKLFRVNGSYCVCMHSIDEFGKVLAVSYVVSHASLDSLTFWRRRGWRAAVCAGCS